jgi:hypothetical protein
MNTLKPMRPALPAHENQSSDALETVGSQEGCEDLA